MALKLPVQLYGKVVIKNRIDVENPNPGQIDYQDNAAHKYLYNPDTGNFPNTPNSVTIF